MCVFIIPQDMDLHDLNNQYVLLNYWRIQFYMVARLGKQVLVNLVVLFLRIKIQTLLICLVIKGHEIGH